MSSPALRRVRQLTEALRTFAPGSEAGRVWPLAAPTQTLWLRRSRRE
jgi:hypothetical protein